MMDITAFFDEATSNVSYVVADPATRACAVIDPVLDYEPNTATLTTTLAQRVVDHIEARQLRVEWLLETHVHADHLSASAWLQARVGGKTAIGARVAQVQEIFGELFNAGDDFARDGRQFDRLLRDGDALSIGELPVRVLETPGHTPACVTYLIGDAAFIGDTLFMPDYGTARCDFPGGDARALYRSVQRLYALPAATRLFLNHDYLPPGRSEFRWESTVGEQRRDNVMLNAQVGEDDFVAARTTRDRQLAKPRLLLPSIQVNMRAGHLPPPDANGRHYLKLPITFGSDFSIS
jgi:glyoxylase-like metal-dependent hydrolase (beta-lactamase superfamily II)